MRDGGQVRATFEQHEIATRNFAFKLQLGAGVLSAAAVVGAVQLFRAR